jgi:glycosyltransferase involved in cell wall biosynthesis
LRIVQANAVYDAGIKTADALLDAYHTLTEWSVAMAKAGAAVSVIQRFHTDVTIERDGITYQFVKDAELPWLVAGIRAAAGSRSAIVVQHHGGEFPIRGSGIVGLFQRQRWRKGLLAANAISFTAAEQAEPWRAAGVLADQRIIEVVEAGTTMRSVNRERARVAIGADGEPLILWVGRLTTNKDPLSVLDGLERALPDLPHARVVMVFGDDTLLPAVEERVRNSVVLGQRVTLAGRVSHDEMPNYYSAADVFVSGSHSEGSGYALIEAMSAGVVPVVTDIPSFRAIAGECGARWAPGDANAFATALLQTCANDLAAQRSAALARFERALSWDAIAARTLAEYQSVFDAREPAVR